MPDWDLNVKPDRARHSGEKDALSWTNFAFCRNVRHFLSPFVTKLLTLASESLIFFSQALVVSRNVNAINREEMG